MNVQWLIDFFRDALFQQVKTSEQSLRFDLSYAVREICFATEMIVVLRIFTFGQGMSRLNNDFAKCAVEKSTPKNKNSSQTTQSLTESLILAQDERWRRA